MQSVDNYRENSSKDRFNGSFISDRSVSKDIVKSNDYAQFYYVVLKLELIGNNNSSAYSEFLKEVKDEVVIAGIYICFTYALIM